MPPETDTVNIAELEAKIRNRINRPHKQRELLDRLADWNVICSALDVIGDTELALDSYLRQEPIQDVGKLYINLYGVLQVLEVQQDAVRHICETMKIKKKKYAGIPEIIRRLRSRSIGHPVKEKENNVLISSFIVRASLRTRSFTLMSFYSDGRHFDNNTFYIPDLIGRQRLFIRDILVEVINRMDQEELKHRSEFREEKLQDTLPPFLSYAFQKIFEAIGNSSCAPMGRVCARNVQEALNDFQRLLKERDEWENFSSKIYEYDLIEYSLNELASYLEGNEISKLNDRDAHIFCSYCSEQIKFLQQIAKEIDERYAADPTQEK